MNKISKVLSMAITACCSLLIIGEIVSCIVNLTKEKLLCLLVILVVVIGLFAIEFYNRKKQIKKQEPQKESQSDTQPNLLPVILGEGAPNYYSVELLKKKLLEGTAKNIALTGIYGSGKSSVLETLKVIDTKHKFLTISLAKLSGKNEFDESQIEYSILQQIFYKEDQSQFPFSKISKIAVRTKKNIVWFALNVLVFFVCLVIIFEPEFIVVPSICSLFYWGTLNFVGDILAALVLLSQSFLFLLAVTPAILRIKGVKFAIQGNEVELSNSESSIINQNLEEILYIFRNIENDVVIFEDIDRFEKPDLFLKLRELNLLLNGNKNIDRHITFIYALRDDTFKAHLDRVKFFDYVVPVIPFVNRSNTVEILKSRLSDLGYKSFDAEKLKEIALHLDDMRIIVNICNEFDTYYNCFKDNKSVDNNKLLAILAYKNLYPQDFALLDRHDKRSKVYRCFSQVKAYREYAIETYNKQGRENIKEIFDKKDAVNKITECEIRIVALAQAVTDSLNGFVDFEIKGHYYSIPAVSKDDELFNSVTGKTVSYRSQNGYRYNGTLDLNEAYRKIDPNYTFDEKIDLLHKYQKDYREGVKAFDRLDKQIRSACVKDLLVKFKASESESYKELNLPPMIESFILRGFIDERFNEYTSLFREGEITKNDHDLLVDMGLSRNISSDRHIENVASLVPNIPDYFYSTNNILLFELVDYHGESWFDINLREKNALLVDNLVNIGDRRRFLSEYYAKGSSITTIFSKLVNEHNVWDSWVLANDDITLTEAWFRFCTKESMSDDKYQWINRNYEFFATRVQLLSIENGTDFRIKGAHFKSLSFTSPQLLEYVGTDDLYELNTHNLSILLTYYSNGIEVKESDVNISRIRSCKEEPINTWPDVALEELIKNVIVQDPGDEDQDGLLFVINDKKISEDAKKQYLTKQTNKIIELAQVLKDYWNFAFEESFVYPSWDNIRYYWDNNNDLPPASKEFIARHKSELLHQKYESSGGYKFELLLISQQWLPEDMFRYIAKCLNGKQYTEGIEFFDEKKLEILHELNLLAFTPSNSHVLKNYPIIYHKYLKRYRKELVERLYEVPMGLSELQYFFDQTRGISSKLKDALLEYTPIQDLFFQSQELLDSVAKYLTLHYNEKISLKFYLKILDSITKNDTSTKLAKTIIENNKYDTDVVDRLKPYLQKDQNNQ